MRRFLYLFLFFLLPLLALQAEPPMPRPEEPLKVGLMANIFGNLDQQKAVSQVKTMGDEVSKRTGVKADFTVVPDLPTLEKDLKAGKLQMAILHGIEYAWLRPSLGEARPLLIAVPEQTSLQSLVLTAANTPAKKLEDLKGQPFALSADTPFHVNFFLRRTVTGSPEQFFRIQATKTSEDAMEDVIDDKAKATAVSESVWSNFQEIKPGRAKRLKVLLQSPHFPAPVLIVRSKDAADPKLVDRFEKSMLQIHESDAGRQTLTLWRLKSFQKVPAEFTQQLEMVAKQYPPEK
jgi:ABC-type phosphate/phosphonate transport system substrate-binding protein